MRNELKSAALALTLGFGIAGIAHASQQPAQPMPRQMPQPGQQMGQPGQASMINNPEMRQRMASMMQACQRMMSQAGAETRDMPGMQQPQ